MLITKGITNIRMNLWMIIKKEMIHKKVGVLTGIICLSMATAGFIGAIILLKGDELATEQLFIKKEKELGAEMLRLEDDYRIIMRNMGYNVLILHKNQSITELGRNGYPTTYLDLEDVWKIAHSGMKTLNHLLPVLQEKIYWEEKNTEILLSGIQGQVPVYSKPSHLTNTNEYLSPIMERVPDGKADLGATIAASHKLNPGDEIIIKGEKFLVNKVYSRKGTNDDQTVWIPLDKAQTILGQPEKINGILALECVCAIEEIGQLKQELEAVLPHVQVFEFSSLISARADVRQRASRLHEEILIAEKAHQMEQRKEKEKLASVLIIVLIAGASIWIFFLILNNVRERKHEIGIFRAIGFSRLKVLWIFLGKSALMGTVGGITGCIIGILFGVVYSTTKYAMSGQEILNISPLIIPGLLLAPALALTAGLIPSILAANQDPAEIIGER